MENVDSCKYDGGYESESRRICKGVRFIIGKSKRPILKSGFRIEKRRLFFPNFISFAIVISRV